MQARKIQNNKKMNLNYTEKVQFLEYAGEKL